MSISSVGAAGFFYQPPVSNAVAQAQAAAEKSASASPGGEQAVQDFQAYMKESPAQHMVDAWLKAHGLTEQDLAKMSPDQRAAIEKEMAADIKTQIEQQMQKKTGADTAGAVATGSLANIVA
jgi:hypothetical protein